MRSARSARTCWARPSAGWPRFGWLPIIPGACAAWCCSTVRGWRRPRHGCSGGVPGRASRAGRFGRAPRGAAGCCDVCSPANRCRPPTRTRRFATSPPARGSTRPRSRVRSGPFCRGAASASGWTVTSSRRSARRCCCCGASVTGSFRWHRRAPRCRHLPTRACECSRHSPNWERPEAVLRELHEFLFDDSENAAGGRSRYAEEDTG
jgi:hypothetical protein